MSDHLAQSAHDLIKLLDQRVSRLEAMIPASMRPKVFEPTIEQFCQTTTTAPTPITLTTPNGATT